MSDPTPTLGTREAVVHLLKVAAKAMGDVNDLPDNELEFGVAVADHAIAASAAHAALAIEARLGEIARHLAELVDAQHTATLLAGSAYGLADLSVVRRLVEALGQTMTGASPGEPSVSITIADDMTAEQIQDALARARQRRDTGTFGGL